jgi:CRP/FNR family transcriptional regulator, nitrogen oxide reductase regulator
MIDLTSTRLFAGLEKKEANAILALAGRRKFKPSEAIIRIEERATHLVLVKKGFVDFFVVTEQGQSVLVRRFVPGDVFGIASLLCEPMGYLGTAIAVNDVEVLTWTQRDGARMAQAYPRFLQNAFRLALRYIAIYAQRHMSLVFDSAQERLAYVLTSVGARTGNTIPTGVEINIRNEDLASLADVSLFTACRLMKKWERAGVVAKGRGRVLIRCPERLLAEEIPENEISKPGGRKGGRNKSRKSLRANL